MQVLLRLEGGLDGPGHERVAAQEADVLAGQPPGPAAHGDDAQDAHADSFQTCSAIAAAGSAVGEARAGVGSGVRPGRHRVMP